MHRRAYLAVSGTALAGGLAGCLAPLTTSDDGPCGGEACDVGMTRNEFVPETYETTVGESVVWKNTSSADHTVSAYDSSIPEGAAYFASGGYEDLAAARDAWNGGGGGGGISPRQTFEHAFEIPGTYRYVCIPHDRAGMTGEIVVRE